MARLPTRLLPRFLLISMALHLILLAGWTGQARLAAVRHLGQPLLDVALPENGRPLTAATKHVVAPPKIPSDALVATSASAHATAAAIETASESSDTTNVNLPEQVESNGQDAGFRNQLQGELQTRLSRYLVYPPLARARGWEGRVLLAFNIETDGQLENIRVAQSSGFAVLDDSALNSLYQVGRLAEAVAWLQGRPLTMQIPVIYQLRCFDGQACREDRVAVSGPENY